MRIIRYIFDLPWWAGLFIFMGANFILPYEKYWLIGFPICLFGAWTFSKLVSPLEKPRVKNAIVGIVIFPLFLYVTSLRYQEIIDYFQWTEQKWFLVEYIVRMAGGLGIGFYFSLGLRK